MSEILNSPVLDQYEQAIEKKVSAVSASAETIAKRAQELVIKTDEDAERAADALAYIKKAIKSSEDERKAFVRPFQQGVKQINAVFTAPREQMERVEKDLRQKITAWETKKAREEAERRRKEEEKRAVEQRKIEEEKKSQLKALEELGIDDDTAAETIQKTAPAPMPEVEEAPAPSTKLRGNKTGASVSFREKVCWKVADESLVPREYLIVDEKRINKEVKSKGEAFECPGIETYVEKVPVVRG